MKRRPKSNPLSARIKRMMQADEDVGKIAGPTPVLIGRALEVFLKDLCEGASDVAIERQARTLTPGHMKHYVHNTPHLDFLKDKFADVADLPEQQAKTRPATSRPPPASRPMPTAKPRKRQRVEEPAELPSSAEGNEVPGMPSATTIMPLAGTGAGSASQAPAMHVAAATAARGKPASHGTADGEPGTMPAQHATDQQLKAMAAAGMSVQDGSQTVIAQADITAGAQAQHPFLHAPQAVAAEEDDYDAD